MMYHFKRALESFGFTINLHDRDEVHAYNSKYKVRVHLENLSDGVNCMLYGLDGIVKGFNTIDELYFYLRLK